MKLLLSILLLCASLTTGATSGLTARAKLAPKANTVNAYIKLTDGLTRADIEARGIKVMAQAGNILTVKASAAALKAVSSPIQTIELSTPVYPMLDVAKQYAGIPVQGLSYEGSAYNGTGVVVGIVDAGFDYAHETFRDANGNLRISRVWEQNGDKELIGQEQILEAQGDITGNSHGTHVAGIAAGSSPYLEGKYSGIAQNAELVLVSIDPANADNVAISNGIAYIFHYADSVGKPCVVNLSLGNQTGPHDGTSMFDQMADNLVGPGHIIVGSAGNHGNDKFHVTGTEFKTFIDYKRSPSNSNIGGDIELWGRSPEVNYSVELISYSTGSKSEVQALPVDMNSDQPQTLTFSKNITGSLTVVAEVSPLNGKRHVLIQSGISNLRNNYHVAIRVKAEGEGVVDAWADNIQVGLTDLNQDGFVGQTNESTIAEIGGTAKGILSVGAYTTRNTYTVLNQTEERTLDETVGQRSSFSSEGPTADGRTKPETYAPGCFIISAASRHDNSGTLILAAENDGNLYSYMQGTSMSAPFVAGIVASWLQACPQLTPEQAKQLAAGNINATAGLEQCLQMSGIAETLSTTDAQPIYYDLMGRRIARPTHGIYIKMHNGKARKIKN